MGCTGRNNRPPNCSSPPASGKSEAPATRPHPPARPPPRVGVHARRVSQSPRQHAFESALPYLSHQQAREEPLLGLRGAPEKRVQQVPPASFRSRAPHFRKRVQAGIHFADFQARLRSRSGSCAADRGPPHADPPLPRASGKKRDYGLDLIARQLPKQPGEQIDLDQPPPRIRDPRGSGDQGREQHATSIPGCGAGLQSCKPVSSPARAGLAFYRASTRAMSIRCGSSGFFPLTTSSSGVATTSPLTTPTRTPRFPAASSSVAATPNRVASIRSANVGGAPRCVYPRIVTRSSKPSCAWCSATYCASPCALGFAPSATTTIACGLPRSYARRISAATCSGSVGHSGITTASAPPVIPPISARYPDPRPITSTSIAR